RRFREQRRAGTYGKAIGAAKAAPATGIQALYDHWEFTMQRLAIMKRLGMAALAVTLGLLLTGRAAAYSAKEIFQRTLNSTAWILVPRDAQAKAVGFGTGWLVEKERKLMITNQHVVTDSKEAVVFFPDTRNGEPVVESSHYLRNAKGIRASVLATD